MDTIVSMILSGHYLPAVGAFLVLTTGVLRWGLTKLHPWFETKSGGYVTAYLVASVTFFGSALQSGASLDGQLLLTTLSSALIASGILDHWRDVFEVAKKTPPSAGAVVAALIFFVVAACTGCPGTTPTGGSVGHAVVTCTDAGDGVFARIKDEVVKFGVILLGDDQACDLTCRLSKIEVLAINDGLRIGGCAFAQVVNDWITKKSLADTDAPASTVKIRAVFEDYRAKFANGASFRAPNGVDL